MYVCENTKKTVWSYKKKLPFAGDQRWCLCVLYAQNTLTFARSTIIQMYVTLKLTDIHPNYRIIFDKLIFFLFLFFLYFFLFFYFVLILFRFSFCSSKSLLRYQKINVKKWKWWCFNSYIDGTHGKLRCCFCSNLNWVVKFLSFFGCPLRYEWESWLHSIAQHTREKKWRTKTTNLFNVQNDYLHDDSRHTRFLIGRCQWDIITISCSFIKLLHSHTHTTKIGVNRSWICCFVLNLQICKLCL